MTTERRIDGRDYSIAPGNSEAVAELAAAIPESRRAAERLYVEALTPEEFDVRIVSLRDSLLVPA